MKIFLTFIVLNLTIMTGTSWAAEQTTATTKKITKANVKKTQQKHAAHKHGAAKIDIAFHGTDGQIDFAAASEGIYGFEYVAKTEKDKGKQHEAFSIMETNIADMIQFDKDIKCEISKQNIEVKQQEGGKHADMLSSFKVLCQKSPIGTTIVFNIQKSFPKLKDVQVAVIADDLQKSLVVKKNGSKLILKK